MDIQKINTPLISTQARMAIDEEKNVPHNQNLREVQFTTAAQKEPAMRSFRIVTFLVILAVVAGVGTGFGTFRLFAKSGLMSNSAEQLPTTPVDGKVQAGDVFGSKDATFDSNAQGYLEAGGLEGEGSHKLLRPGGPSQTVYLASSVTDLDEFVGMEIKIWGETFRGQKAGWFMDVGRVEVITVNGEAPTE